MFEIDLCLLGYKMRTKREQQGLSRDELARMIDKSSKMIFRYEKGETSPPLSVLVEIANALGTTPLEFLPDWDIESIRMQKAIIIQQEYMTLYNTFYEQAGNDPVRALSLVKEVHNDVKHLIAKGE